MYIFKHIINTFTVGKNFNLKPGTVKKPSKLPAKAIPHILEQLKDPKYYEQFYTKNIELTQKKIKEDINQDNLIIQTISAISEIDKVTNILSKRLREWYSLYYPELSQEYRDHEQYAELVISKKKKVSTMGADLLKKDVEVIEQLASQLSALFNQRKSLEEYLGSIMKSYCPNLVSLAGVTIAAKLINLAKGLRRMALLPASTIQLLGAEKALFRHIKSGARSPKHGIIIHHPLVQNAGRDKGKAARMLADKLVLCARLDYFKGEFMAEMYRKDLEEKLG